MTNPLSSELPISIHPKIDIIVFSIFRHHRDYEASSIPEDGELSAEEAKKGRSRKRSRSESSSSRSSRDEIKVTKKYFRKAEKNCKISGNSN